MIDSEERLTNYDQNNIFWKDFSKIPNNQYQLNNSLNGFKTIFTFLTEQSPFSEKDYPLPIGYMASLVRMNGGKATISIKNVEDYKIEDYNGYDLASFYPMAVLFNQIMEFSNKVKKDNPQIKTCMFNSDQHQHEMLLCNPKAKDFGRKMMQRFPSLDYILIGEAESSFIQLCEKIYRGDSNLDDVPSCLYRGESGIELFSSSPIKPVDFTSLPFSSRDYLEDHISNEGINTFSPRIQSSRGCLAPCLYCVEASSNIIEGGRKKAVMKRDGKIFVDEIEMLQKKYGVTFFNIIDSSFEDSGKKGLNEMDRFCDDIVERGIEASFKIHLRGETVDKFDNDFLDKMKYAGIDIVIPGIESGLERELRTYKKLTTPEKSANAIRKLESYGKFFSVLGYIMFSPILEIDELPKKMEYLKELGHEWDILNTSYSMLVFPGTRYHEFIKSEGLELKHDDLDTIIPYRFVDERVEFVAEEMGSLKIKNPEIMGLHNLIMDSKNVGSRFYNKMNVHLQKNFGAFEKFERELKEITNETGKHYYNFFMEIVDLAKKDYSKESANIIRKSHIDREKFRVLYNRASDNLGNFLKDCEGKGLSTNKLYLKTWMSLIGSRVNTTSGKIVTSSVG